MGLPLETATKCVQAFFARFNLYSASRIAEAPPLKVVQQRVALHDEEHAELLHAIETDNLVAIADAIADNIYAHIGTALVYGIPIDRVFMEVHVTNMTKALPLVEGKPTKPPKWHPPHIARALVEAEQAKHTQQ